MFSAGRTGHFAASTVCHNNRMQPTNEEENGKRIIIVKRKWGKRLDSLLKDFTILQETSKFISQQLTDFLEK